ncbi:MAG: glycosyltransferase family 2 protein [Candidatus Gottesmanbacteria bacterium]
MKRKIYPTISILTITYNPNPAVFTRSLESIKKQHYPKNKLEHIIVDGGSRELTILLAKRYGCTVIIRKDLRDQSEARRSYAVKKAKNEIILWLESDNILEDTNSLSELVQPFIDDPKIISSFPLHYGYNKHGSILDRYSALFGGCDPVVLYLKKTDREPWYSQKYSKGKLIRKKKAYEVIQFDESTLPTVGDNGFLTRRSVLLQAHIRPEQYVHIDIYIDLLKLGYNRFAVVHSTSIEHIIGNSLIQLLQKRMVYAKRFSLSPHFKNRRYFVYNSNSIKDKARLLLFVFYSFTFIQPVWLSIRGYMMIRDLSWFLHPIASFLFMLYYMRTTLLSINKTSK